MNIINATDYEHMSALGARRLVDLVVRQKEVHICVATGGSPTLMYRYFVKEINDKKINISQVTFITLDEWLDVAQDAPFTCATFLKEHLLDVLHDAPKAALSFPTQSDNPTQACVDMQTYLEEHPLDICILGLGMNGHLGLNEPAPYLDYNTHIAPLSETTKTHDMVQGLSLTRGITIGLGGIFAAQQILMLVCGTRKEDAFHEFMSQRISTTTPASLLWLHPRCDTIIDRSQFK